MGINLSNFLSSQTKNKRMKEFQDLDHIEGVSVSTVNANLYENPRDDLVMFYFREGANHASIYTQSKIVSENLKWNLSNKPKKIFTLLVNTRNANCFTGKQGYKSLEKIAETLSNSLTEKQKLDEDQPRKIRSKEVIFGCTGTIGEVFPEEKIKNKITLNVKCSFFNIIKKFVSFFITYKWYSKISSVNNIRYATYIKNPSS